MTITTLASASTNIPAGDRRTYAVAGLSLPPTAYVDADGDRWVVTAERTPDGEQVLACPEPQDPGDQGVGPSYPWTLRLVEMAFGPLTEVRS
ncbi:phiSA1p31-related protein [Streptomyces sp. NPDC050504]|uniref:phiSA1p31-related protein n=1 Tax=Streptomyces sp. NPDC050504 TaxID=3365618 RepID=UPI0037886F4F